METATDTIEVNNSAELVRLPLWKQLIQDMRTDGLDYLKSWPTEFFEKALRSNRNTPQFVFEMLGLRQELEEEDGYYLRSSENGKLYSIPSAADHEEVAVTFEQKLKRYARRSIALRNSTLTNEKAILTDEERRRMQHSLERASIRLALLSRQQSVENSLRQHAPKLLGDAPVE